MTTSDVRQKLQAIYDRMPKVDCKGVCWNACGPIDMSNAERDRIVELGVEIPLFTSERAQRWANNERLYCPALSYGAGPDGRVGCKVYEARPLICRAWGVVDAEDMRCPHGCEIDGDPLSPTDLMILLAEAMRVGGKEGLDTQKMDELLRKDPRAVAALQRFMDGDHGALNDLVDYAHRRP